MAGAETHLGLLGWQQADYDTETQRQVDALQNIEREQARLTNRSAELAQELQSLSEKRAKARAAYEQQRTALEGERSEVRRPLIDLQRRLNVTQSSMADEERLVTELEEERRDVEKLSNKLLLVHPQPPDTRNELMRLRDRLLAINNEQRDLRASHARGLMDTQQLKHQIGAIENRSADFDRRLREMRDAFEGQDEGLAREEEERMDAKKKAEAESDQLERAKSDPYREIGRVLADNNIAPMNQPQALEQVLNLRDRVLKIETAIAKLLQESKSANRYDLRISLALWGAVFLALALMIAALR